MAFHIISSDSSTQIVAQITGDVWILKEGIYLTVGAHAIDGSGALGSKTFQIDGHLFSDGQDGIRLGIAATSSSGNNTVIISETGSINSWQMGIRSFGGGLHFINDGLVNSELNQGVYAEDGNNIMVNNGTIIAGSSGMIAPGDNNFLSNTGVISAEAAGMFVYVGDFNTAVNSGTIHAHSSGIHSNSDFSSLTNSGSIFAAGVGAHGMSVNAVSNSVFNSGIISVQGVESHGISIESSDATNVINSGQISVQDDLAYAVNIDGLSGTSNRLINTGLLSAPDIAVSGGDGDEVVVNRGVIDGDVSLGGGDDVFRGRDGSVDGVVKGGTGADVLIGSKLDDDTLRGGNGDDILKGRGGDDTLTGNGGADVFVFGRNHDNDVITDFVDGQDKLDLSGFGFANKAAALAEFYELGGTANDKLAFQHAGSHIIINGIDMADLGNSDILI